MRNQNLCIPPREDGLVCEFIDFRFVVGSEVFQSGGCKLTINHSKAKLNAVVDGRSGKFNQIEDEVQISS